MTTAVTTFSKDGYELYGHRMIETWIQFWPETFKLIVYVEGFNLVEKDSRITEIDLESVCPDLVTFKKNSGLLFEKNKENKRERHRIQKTIKWCHKVYAMKHALNCLDDYVIFLDGDTYTKTPVPLNFAKMLVEDDLFAVHFENLKNGLHFETGLVVFNATHNQTGWLKENLTSAYDSLDIYNMKKTWDGYWFAHLYQVYKLPVKNLSGSKQGVFCHPAVNSILTHNVGIKKYTNAGYNEYTGRKI
jgi:hypothetical protein